MNPEWRTPGMADRYQNNNVKAGVFGERLLIKVNSFKGRFDRHCSINRFSIDWKVPERRDNMQPPEMNRRCNDK